MERMKARNSQRKEINEIENNELKENLVKSALKLFWIFFKLGFISFGGGIAILKIYEEALVEKRKLITKEELLNFYAMSQIIPGIIIINTASLIGKRLLGTLGMISASLGCITPSVCIIVLISKYFTKFSENIYINEFLHGINIAVIAIIILMTFELFKSNIRSISNFILLVFTIGLLVILNLPIYLVVIISIAYTGMYTNVLNAMRLDKHKGVKK